MTSVASDSWIRNGAIVCFFLNGCVVFQCGASLHYGSPHFGYIDHKVAKPPCVQFFSHPYSPPQRGRYSPEVTLGLVCIASISMQSCMEMMGLHDMACLRSQKKKKVWRCEALNCLCYIYIYIYMISPV